MTMRERLLQMFQPKPAPRVGGKVVRLPSGEKGLSLRLDPSIQFVSPDGGRTIHRLFAGTVNGSDPGEVTRDTAFAAAAYLYVAIRYRMKKISEAPMMVVKEDKDGNQKWLPKHPLEVLLDRPSDDFDMGELVARTVGYLDFSGAALWVKNGRPGTIPTSLSVFHRGEFVPEAANGRMYGRFRIDTAKGPEYKTPEEVIYFHDINPGDWYQPVSMVDACLSWLNLSQQARAATIDILRHSLFPSVIVLADPEWNPDEPEYEKWKDDLRAYAERDQRGGPLGLVGGGSATRIGLTLKDLIPGDILDRVESVVAAVSGIPAIVLQYQIGLANSPWSQMAQARRMAYEDTIEPFWQEFARRVTRQLLWAPVQTDGAVVEGDRQIRVVFDTSDIRALQVDKIAMASVVQAVSQVASVNERRQLMGLEPSKDPRADEIPEITRPQPPAGGTVGLGDNPFSMPDEDTGRRAGDAQPDDEQDDDEEVERSRRDPFSRKQTGSHGGGGSTWVPSRLRRNGNGRSPTS